MANEKFSDLSEVTTLNSNYLFCVASSGVNNYKITAGNILDGTNLVLTAGKISLSTSVTMPGTLQLGGNMNADGYNITDVVALVGATGAPSYLRTNTANTDSLALQAYDVDGASYVTFITLTAANTPTCDLSDSVTKNGQYIYRVGGLDVSAGDGGTGISSYAVGDILYASGVTTLSKLAAVATGNALISGGVTTAPSWGKIGLATHVSGTLPTANGGTGQTTYTAGQLLIGKNDGTLAKATLTAGTGISISNGDGTITITNTGAAGDVTGIIGTASQILANGTSGSSQEGEVTLTLASTIQTGGGTFTTGGTSYGLSNTPTLTLGTQNSLAGVVRLLGVDASAYSVIQSTTVNLHIDSPNTASSFIYLNNYATTAAGTIIQPNGGNIGLGTGNILYKSTMVSSATDITTTTPIFGMVNSANPRYATGITTSHQTGVGNSFHIHVGDSGSNGTALTNTPAFSVSTTQIVTVGQAYAPVNDSNMQFQLKSPGTAATERYMGVSKGNGYGFHLGYITGTGLGTGGILRQITSDPVYLYVNSTTLAMCVTSGGKVLIGTTTLQADNLTNDLQLGVAGSTKGMSLAMNGTYIRLREVGTANQLCLSANWATGSQDSGTFNSWLFNMYCAASADTVSIQRSPPGSTSLSTLWILQGAGEMRTGKIWNGYLSSISNANTNARYDALADGSTVGYSSTAFGTTGAGNSSGFFARHARGTQASPTASQSGDLFGIFGAQGYYTTGTPSFSLVTGGMLISASENFTNTANGTSLSFIVTPNGTTTSITPLTIANDGACTLGASSTTPTHRLNTANTTGASTGTLTNCPVAGNPATYITININGTNRYVPAF